MSLHNDYIIGIVSKQQQSEFLAHAAEDRLARLVPGRTRPWWHRLFHLGATRSDGSGFGSPAVADGFPADRRVEPVTDPPARAAEDHLADEINRVLEGAQRSVGVAVWNSTEDDEDNEDHICRGENTLATCVEHAD